MEKLLSQYTSISGPGFFEEHKDLLNGNKSYWIKASGDISKEWFKALLIPLSHKDYYLVVYQIITESVIMEEKLAEQTIIESEKKH